MWPEVSPTGKDDIIACDDLPEFPNALQISNNTRTGIMDYQGQAENRLDGYCQKADKRLVNDDT